MADTAAALAEAQSEATTLILERDQAKEDAENAQKRLAALQEEMETLQKAMKKLKKDNESVQGVNRQVANLQ